MSSVLRDWVMALPLREQGTLLVAMRGCDTAPKNPLDSLERRLTAAIRFAVCHPADAREVDSEPGCFMLSEPPDANTFRVSALEHYPMHYVMHAIHAAEVIGYRHPHFATADKWARLYFKMVKGLHLRPEQRNEMVARCSEDRIASGEIVS